VYVFWSLLSRSGLEAGSARTQYIAFPASEARFTSPQTLRILPLEEQPYGQHRGFFNLTKLVLPASIRGGSDFVHQPVPAAGEHPELAVAVTVNQPYRQDQVVQVAVALFAEGRFQGYELAAKTSGLSTNPVLQADETGQLHLLWREGAAGQEVYYATTAPLSREILDRLDRGDVTHTLLEGGLESLAALAFFPWVGLGWLMPGLLILGLWKILRDYEDLNYPPSRVFLVFALLVYYVAKLVTLPTITTYIPFSAWVDLPPAWQRVLQIGIPLLILGTSLLVAEWVRRRRTSSTLVYYLAFSVCDALLTLFVYGVNFLGL
jgi:hypothetical protein